MEQGSVRGSKLQRGDRGSRKGKIIVGCYALSYIKWGGSHLSMSIKGWKWPNRLEDGRQPGG